MDQTDCFDKKAISLPHVRCEKFEGWLYVSLNHNIASVGEMLSSLSKITAPYAQKYYVTIFTEQHE